MMNLRLRLQRLAPRLRFHMSGGAEWEPGLSQHLLAAQHADLVSRLFFPLDDQTDGAVGERPEPFDVERDSHAAASASGPPRAAVTALSVNCTGWRETAGGRR